MHPSQYLGYVSPLLEYLQHGGEVAVLGQGCHHLLVVRAALGEVAKVELLLQAVRPVAVVQEVRLHGRAERQDGVEGEVGEVDDAGDGGGGRQGQGQVKKQPGLTVPVVYNSTERKTSSVKGIKQAATLGLVQFGFPPQSMLGFFFNIKHGNSEFAYG